jgi:hypothetical protein
MSSENQNPQLSELINLLIPLLKEELRNSDRKRSRVRSRNSVEGCGCSCCDHRSSRSARGGETMSGNGTVVCKDNPNRCCMYVDDVCVPISVVDNASVFLASQAIDQTIVFWRSGQIEIARVFLESVVGDICGTTPPKFPFPWPLPRDLTTEEFSQKDWFLAAVEFEHASKLTEDEVLKKLFQQQATVFMQKSLNVDNLR